MNVSTVTSLREAKEPAQEEPAQPVSGQSPEGQSAFAVLLALLQGLAAPAADQNGTGTALVEGQGDEQEAPAPAGALAALADSTAADALMNAVSAPSSAAPTSAETKAVAATTATGASGPVPVAVTDTTANSVPGTPVTAASEQLEAPGANPLVAQGAFGAESGLPADAEQSPMPAGVAAAESSQGKAVSKPVQEGSPAQEQSAEDAEVIARPVLVAKADLGEASEDHSGTPERSSARYVVAKAGQVSGGHAEPIEQGLHGSVSAQSKPGQVTDESVGDSGDSANPLEAAASRLTGSPQSEPRANAGPRAHVETGQARGGETPALNLVSLETAAEGRAVERTAQTAAESAEPSQTTLKTLAHDTVKGVRYLLARGEQTLRIRLIPESLGELRLEVTSTKEEISVRLSSANQTVRELLHTQVHGLRDALTQDGTTVTRISIVADTGTGMTSQGGNADRAFSQQARTWNEGGTHASTNTPQQRQQSPVAPRTQAPHAGALNLFA
ncbi:MAG: flagellar hook-length control protein FliK [Candidatus Hydrogenedentes bacterium]|nr:flagellar hook-length control protein FliK [Candidatus Hydrogenedentota bacterium]